MQIVYDEESLREYFETAARASDDHPVLIDRFLEDAFEADVDAIGDGEQYVIGGVMQHIEDAGIHSGDSACVLPPYLIAESDIETMRAHTIALAKALGVVGLINVQFAIKDDVVYVLEVNPRASRTMPFVSEGDRRVAGVARGAGDARRDAGGPRVHRGDHAAVRVGEGSGVPVQQVPGIRSDPWARNALDGRGHGDLRELRQRVRQGAARGRQRTAVDRARS